MRPRSLNPWRNGVDSPYSASARTQPKRTLLPRTRSISSSAISGLVRYAGDRLKYAPRQRVHHPNHQAVRHRQWLRRAAPPLGGRTFAGMAQQESTPCQRLRLDHRLSNRIALHRIRSALCATDRKVIKSCPIILDQTLERSVFGVGDHNHLDFVQCPRPHELRKTSLAKALFHRAWGYLAR